MYRKLQYVFSRCTGAIIRCSIYGRPGLFVVGLAVAVSTAACSSATTSSPSPFSDRPTTVELEDEPWSPDEIGHAEIVSRGDNYHTAMELIRRLRPGWLRARGQNSFTDASARYPVVYLDEIRHGALSTLYGIPSSQILSMRFVGTADATTRWGTGHPAGVINIATGR